MSKDSNLAVVFVTVPAAGIGQELAHLLAKHRSQLISVDQNAEGLRRFADHLRAQHGVPRSSPRPWPRWGAAQAVYQAVQADVWVNDAGFGEYGMFFDFSIERNSAAIHTNILALVELIYLFGYDMKGRGKGWHPAARFHGRTHAVTPNGGFPRHQVVRI